MARRRLIIAAALAALAAACAPTLGPQPQARRAAEEPSFRASEFAWSQKPGSGAIEGRLAYARGQVRYSCRGASVILTPETAWSRRRMEVLYLSAERAALPVDQVRARTPEAPAGDSSPYIKRTVCDPNDRFTFARLPAGSWYAITIAKPLFGGGPTMAVMRRVTTRGGRATELVL